MAGGSGGSRRRGEPLKFDSAGGSPAARAAAARGEGSGCPWAGRGRGRPPPGAGGARGAPARPGDPLCSCHNSGARLEPCPPGPAPARAAPAPAARVARRQGGRGTPWHPPLPPRLAVSSCRQPLRGAARCAGAGEARLTPRPVRGGAFPWEACLHGGQAAARGPWRAPGPSPRRDSFSGPRAPGAWRVPGASAAGGLELRVTGLSMHFVVLFAFSLITLLWCLQCIFALKRDGVSVAPGPLAACTRP